MDSDSKIFVAGHNGLVGSAIVRNLESNGHTNIITRTRDELDLTNSDAVKKFFMEERPEYVFLAAAKVGGIGGNADYPADFIYENLMIQSNVISVAAETGVEKLLFLGSSCIYPKFAKQPITEDQLLTGSLEGSNDASYTCMEKYDGEEHINVGTGEDVTIKELAEMIVEVTGYKNDYEWDTSKPNGTPRKVLNVDKVKSLGWEPKISLREGLESTYEWMKNNRSNLRIYNRSELDYGN